MERPPPVAAGAERGRTGCSCFRGGGGELPPAPARTTHKDRRMSARGETEVLLEGRLAAEDPQPTSARCRHYRVNAGEKADTSRGDRGRVT